MYVGWQFLSTTNHCCTTRCPAGTAAVNIGGSTLHSFTGILGKGKTKVKLAEGLWCWAKYKESWRQTDVLLVDEVSMVDCDTLEKVCKPAAGVCSWCWIRHHIISTSVCCCLNAV
jgi:hypothetical protein